MLTIVIIALGYCELFKMLEQENVEESEENKQANRKQTIKLKFAAKKKEKNDLFLKQCNQFTFSIGQANHDWNQSVCGGQYDE